MCLVYSTTIDTKSKFVQIFQTRTIFHEVTDHFYILESIDSFLQLCYNFIYYMDEITLFRKILRDNGYSTTKARNLIFDLLLGSEPQTMHQLTQATSGSVDRVSIYRVIELFEKLGIVQRINIGWKYKIELSDIFLEHHHHMTCLQCGRVIAAKDDKSLESMITELSKKAGFTLTAHQLEMQGYCEHCQLSRVS